MKAGGYLLEELFKILAKATLLEEDLEEEQVKSSLSHFKLYFLRLLQFTKACSAVLEPPVL